MKASEESLIRHVQIYPSQSCTYTLNKSIVFIRVSINGEFLPECALHHIILHELAHVINDTVGHDTSFWSKMKQLGKGVKQCPEKVPRTFNECH